MTSSTTGGARRPSLATLAAELGVSTATVSNAYNRPDRVSAALRAKVLAAAARQGYTGPDAAARQLRRGRTDAVGLLLAGDLGYAIRDPATSGFLEGLADVCAGAGQNLLLVCSPTGREERLRSVSDAVVDGFVVLSVAPDDDRLARLSERGLPTVFVDAPAPDANDDWVGPDDLAASRGLADALVALGHRRIGVLTYGLGGTPYSGPVGPVRLSAVPEAPALVRIRGIEASLAATGSSDLVIEERPDNSAASGADALHALLDRRPDVTAICCTSDVLALGALTAARQRGLDVPRDLTVVGFDDVPEAERVGLTTVAQPHVEKGRVAGQLLLSRATRTAPRRHVLPTVLHMRRTSGPARTS